MRHSRNLALAAALGVVLLLTIPAIAHAGTRVNDERFSGTVLAPTGAAGVGTAAIGLGGAYAGAAIFNLLGPAAADSFVDFRAYGVTSLASYGFTYKTASGARGDLDCSLPPSPNAHFTCSVPKGTNQIAVYVFEDVLAEVTGTLWHVE